MRIGVVTGLRAEAAILKRDDVMTVVAGGDPARVRQLAQELVGRGATALMSFGVAGGLAPGLARGSLIVADRVLSDGASHDTDAAWHRRLLTALPEARSGIVFGSGRIVASAAAKAECHRATGAVAVDMESHLVAAVAARAGLPFAVLRAVADSAECDLPAAAVAAFGGNGIAYRALILSLLRRPGQLPDLLRLGFDTRAALKSLLRGGAGLGPGLGLGL
jgi:hopanoid-associated phosphorylase